MALCFVWISLAFCIHASLASNVLDDTFHLGNQSCKHTLPKVDMSIHCSQDVNVDSPLIIVPTIHPYFVLKNCLNCTVTLRTSPDRQIVCSLYTIGTQTSDDGKCGLNRLDIYDGDREDLNNLLSDKDGICGCKFPTSGEFKSSNNTMTLHFQTKCEGMMTQHGELDLVITAVKNDMFNVTDCHGEFECQSGECIDKNLVCNGKNDCKDHSDEVGCHIRNGTCPGEFECADGSCIDKNLVCNGQNNCPDHSDEMGCRRHENTTCPGKFECSNGRCIDKNKVCNGENDCGDKSDETGCHHKGMSRLLLYILLGVAGVCFILLVVIVIILCCKYCCISLRMATVYRRLS